jgi:hypothetical protein
MPATSCSTSLNLSVFNDSNDHSMKLSFNYAYRYSIFLLLALIAGCASLEKPQSFQEQILYTQYGLVAAVEIAADLKERGKLSQSDADKIVEQVQNADAALKAARMLSFQGKPKEAQDYLQTANGMLRQLEAYLRARG